MATPKRYRLLFLFCFLCIFSNAQNINWMLGTWKGAGNSRKAQFVRTLEISAVSGNNFSGTRSKEAHDRTNSKIVTSVTGTLSKDTFYVKDGAVLFRKDPPNAKWLDCTHCIPTNRVVITYDSVFLSSEVIGCADYCDGTSVYYKLLPDLDTATQRSLVNDFGTPDQVVAFKPFIKNVPAVVSSDPDSQKPNEDSIKKSLALEKKRQQQIDDSLSIVKKQEEQRIQDSLQNAAIVAKKRQKQIDDSLKLTAALEKKRQQYILDSINIVKQQEQQRLLDSLQNAAAIAKKRQQEIEDSTIAANNLTKKRQQQIDDSLKIVAAAEEKRLQHIQDSINVAKQQAQQRLQDSLNNVAIAAKKRQQEIQDSTNALNAFAKKRQQQIDDSLKIVAAAEEKRLQHIQDSISITKQQQQQRLHDSLNNAAIAAKKRQQEILDSTNAANLLAKKRQQQIDDSLKVVADNEKKRQQHIQDSISIAKQQQQQRLQDSLNNAAIAAKKRQQEILDSTNAANLLAKKQQQHIDDSSAHASALAKIKQQETEDSIKIAAGKKTTADTSKNIVATKTADKAKLLTQRDNVLLQTYHINTPDILIELFDNAEIDGDRVSVFHNNSLIVNNQTLLREPITFKIHADTANRTHEFVLIAENLGTIPPNTALMRITVGQQVYKLSVKTDLKTNAKIIFYYDGN